MEVRNLSSDAEDFTGNVWLLKGSENVLIDVGEGDCWEEISELESISKVILTHTHHDHIGNLSKIVEKYDPVIYCFEPENIDHDAEKISEDDTIELNGSDFKVFHTPGHKDDSLCLYSKAERVLFTGDLIFPEGSHGRTDLKEGDRDLLIDSIEKIEKLDADRFYSGHGEAVVKDANDWITQSLKEAKKRNSKY